MKTVASSGGHYTHRTAHSRGPISFREASVRSTNFRQGVPVAPVGRCAAMRWAVLSTLLVVTLGACSKQSSDDAAAPVAADEQAIEEDAFELTDPVPAMDAVAITRADCEPFPEADWTESDGVITTDGVVKGYLATTALYGPGTITLEYRFLPNEGGSLPDESANTGLLLLMSTEDRIWPNCIEAQGKFAELAELKANGTGEIGDVNPLFDDATRDNARRPVGQWNSLRVTITPDEVRSVLNDMPIALCRTNGRVGGRIGIQSEGFPVEFRNWTVTAAKVDEITTAAPETSE